MSNENITPPELSIELEELSEASATGVVVGD